MIPFHSPIFVSRPSLPKLSDFASRLSEIWDSKWLTNDGPVLQQFERKLTDLLGTPNVSLFTNGTLALQIGLQGLGLSGEVITTPFTFAATANALVQCGLAPVFADIEPQCLTIDPASIEALITPRTSAIVAVHVFGLPCRLAELSAIAERHQLALIYDAAHAFGVAVDGKPISAFGDISMFSFHATKSFHSMEGGALVFARPELKRIFDTLRNHGLEPDGDVRVAGTNAKMTEMQALMGELMLPQIDPAIRHGRDIETVYRDRLGQVPGIGLLPPPQAGIKPNHAFMPILVDEPTFGMSRDAFQARLKQYNVFARAYFSPLVSNMTAFREFRRSHDEGFAKQISSQILALPSYTDLPLADVHRICDIVLEIQNT